MKIRVRMKKDEGRGDGRSRSCWWVYLFECVVARAETKTATKNRSIDKS